MWTEGVLVEFYRQCGDSSDFKLLFCWKRDLYQSDPNFCGL